jgi:hypothetical protein
MSDSSPQTPERLGYTAMSLLTLAPAVVQGLWRPLAVTAGVELDAAWLVCAALAVASAAVVACGLPGAPRPWLPAASAALTAVVLGALLGGVGRAGASAAAALLGVALFCGALGPWLLRNLPSTLDGLATGRKVTTALMILLGAASVGATTQLSIYMADPARTERSLAPESEFLVHHSCLSAYVQGTRLAQEGVENLYAVERWPHLSDSAEASANGAQYAPFVLDTYAYPPPFLLLTRLLLSPLGDFASQRSVWFLFNVLCCAVGLWTVARWVGGAAGLRALLLAPLVWTTQAALVTFQVGNVHFVIVTAVMLALVAFDTRRPAVGGALLAFAVLSKISPALLVLVLLLQRRVWEVLWTAAWCAVLSLASVAVFGLAPWVAFIQYQLPRLGSGEALAFLALPDSVIINLSPFGLPFKLDLMGVHVADKWALGGSLTQLFSLGLLLVTASALRKDPSRRSQAELWAALLTLASLRSPLAPGYVLISLVWALTLAAVEVRGAPAVIAATLLWLSMTIPVPATSPALIGLGLLQQAFMVLLTVYLVVRRTPVEAESAMAG